MAKVNSPFCDALLSRLNAKRKTNYTYLKPKQEEALLWSESCDVSALLPTGYGKTIIIEALPFLTDTPKCVIVMNPLTTIIEEQSQRFGKSAVVITDTVVKEIGCQGTQNTRLSQAADQLLNGFGDVHYILGHPENLLQPHFKRFLLQPAISSRISHIVVDEAHCVLSWGKSAFRPAYFKIGSIRAVLPVAKMLALTATATSKACVEIQEALKMQKGKVIMESPDRPNIFLEVKERPPTTGGDYTPMHSYCSVLDPYFKRVQEELLEFPKTIVYMPLKWCGEMHHHALSKFPTRYAESATSLGLISQYHAPQSEQMKKLISQDMKSLDGEVRLLLATQAYGMGADAPNVREVVHIGPPSQIETYLQEIGRCGRDGEASKATLFYNRSDIGANVKHLSDGIRTYCKLQTCRREYLLSYFGIEHTQLNSHQCCDVCLHRCSCINCKSTATSPPSSLEAQVPLKENREHDIINKVDAKAMLMFYFEAENDLVTDCAFPPCQTGLTESLADALSAGVMLTSEAIQTQYPYLRDHYITNICYILNTFIN